MELPTKLEKTSLKEYAQLDERFQVRYFSLITGDDDRSTCAHLTL